MSRTVRLPPTYVRSEYNPNLRTVQLPRNASVYEEAHEYAHALQHKEETRIWRWHATMMHTPYLCRFTRLLLEWEASRMALASLRRLELCSGIEEREARAGLRTYVTALFW